MYSAWSRFSSARNTLIFWWRFDITETLGTVPVWALPGSGRAGYSETLCDANQRSSSCRVRIPLFQRFVELLVIAIYVIEEKCFVVLVNGDSPI